MNTINNDEDIFNFINRLLGMQQQSDDNNNKGCNFTLVYVASGGQHVDRQYVIGDKALEMLKGKNKGVANALPPELSTPKAMELWRKAQQAGYVDDNFQPLISRTLSALMADYMAYMLGLKDKWKPFEILWDRRNMASDFALAYSQKQSLDFQVKLKKTFG